MKFLTKSKCIQKKIYLIKNNKFKILNDKNKFFKFNLKKDINYF